jgi:ferrous iron transport protein A
LIIVRNFLRPDQNLTLAFPPRLIDSLAIGEVALIAAIDRAGLQPQTAQRLCELGFDEGVDVEILHRAPFGGDPIAVRVGNMVVALRRDMARLIEVEA